jgi:soluble P-type ATPase
MITLNIPGHKDINAEHLVLDYNGTLAIDGKLIQGVRELLCLLKHNLQIHILTADTFGTSQTELLGLDCTLSILSSSSQDIQKMDYILNLGQDKVVAIGNGQNDKLMLQKSALSIMVIQKEGAYAKLFNECDIVCFSIIDALEILLNPKRIIASLRK